MAAGSRALRTGERPGARIGDDARRRRRAGMLAAAFVLAFCLLPLALLPLLAGILPVSPVALLADPYLRTVFGFTLLQAVLSTLLSVAFGIPLAMALDRLRFPGRALLLRLFFLPQALPVLVGALGLITVFGRNGVVADAFVLAGLPRPSIYGLTGILVAHVFFNMPLVARLTLGGLSGVPAESWKIAGQLSLSRWATFRIVEWPVVRRTLGPAAGLVFMLCVTSFTLVLVLGGGPGATTLEVAIYQSLRYDFDPARALTLSLVQVGLVALLLLPTTGWTGGVDAGFGLAQASRRFDRRSVPAFAWDATVVATATAFLLAPLLAILVAGLQADLPRIVADPAFLAALSRSLAIAVAASILGLVLSAALAFGTSGAGRGGGILLSLSSSLVLVVPPIVVGAGWFLTLREIGDVARFAPAIVVIGNAILVVPYATRILAPEVAAVVRRHGRLADHLGLRGFARLRHVEWPALRRPLALAGAFGMAVSLGDLGVVALFGNSDLVTLPYLLLQRMGSYRSTDAEGIALLLALLCLGLILLAERGLGGRKTPE
ncbi:thiamine/thiamine pyrophosphate ABC transporter permease [Aureimonas phyllosphaerae]|uniref:Thiamine transport system permease protein ThiP n=1 Tax=Aureimonas phyllosphaerae TaxID=1166078 RepID=A0A7W6FW71_9HYPH|nr:thiamine/thiamine pyrophosphate ABC transporter permease [Aureimonas phyllosphaerae]MBB3937891.1 thiamine transport system permease protein [Aureimonas phyllosphaerae]MBB3961936.1 thiamine transport system permease protein [Aureimonas phyllosphaerae]SFF57159.1 thiamine transport system permease protein [Aureimonas phyllosphaerae]